MEPAACTLPVVSGCFPGQSLRPGPCVQVHLCCVAHSPLRSTPFSSGEFRLRVRANAVLGLPCLPHWGHGEAVPCVCAWVRQERRPSRCCVIGVSQAWKSEPSSFSCLHPPLPTASKGSHVGVDTKCLVYQSKIYGLLAGHPQNRRKRRGDVRGTQGSCVSTEGWKRGNSHRQCFPLVCVSWVRKRGTLSGHRRSSQLMETFQEAVTECWDRCLAGVWVFLGPSDRTVA